MKIRWPMAVGLAAAVIAMAAISYFAGSKMKDLGGSSIAATVTDTDALAERSGLRIGQPLKKGNLTVPDQSEIGIAMRGGARLQVKGPADLKIDGPDRIFLSKGRVSTYAPEYAHGFTVETLDGKIIDLGTQFVTAAGTDEGTEIHVLDGLVEAGASKDKSTFQSLVKDTAGILKDGKLKETEFLAQRLNVPLNPVLPDQDGDGFPDVIERFYGSRSDDASSRPVPLRLEESFGGYSIGPFHKRGFTGYTAMESTYWQGWGKFVKEGLTFAKGGGVLKAGGGALQTTGEADIASVLRVNSKDFAPEGILYMSFLMRLPAGKPEGCFAVFMLHKHGKEEFFVGKPGSSDSFSANLKSSEHAEQFELMDEETHLFVIKIDRTRLVTDVFLDPVPGMPETSAVRKYRYNDVPEFDRISVKSGSVTDLFPVMFDEIRIGLTWDSVLPVAQ
ncbi:MAG: hypothetical protein QM627_05830 [Luteolibacter sp.]